MWWKEQVVSVSPWVDDIRATKHKSTKTHVDQGLGPVTFQNTLCCHHSCSLIIADSTTNLQRIPIMQQEASVSLHESMFNRTSNRQNSTLADAQQSLVVCECTLHRRNIRKFSRIIDSTAICGGILYQHCDNKSKWVWVSMWWVNYTVTRATKHKSTTHRAFECTIVQIQSFFIVDGSSSVQWHKFRRGDRWSCSLDWKSAQKGSKMHHVANMPLPQSALDRSKEMHAGRMLRDRRIQWWQEESREKTQRNKRRRDEQDDGTTTCHRINIEKHTCFSPHKTDWIRLSFHTSINHVL